MKKILSILIALCLVCLLVSACAEESVCGTWRLNSVENGGATLSREGLDAQGADMILVLNDDGTFTDTEILGTDKYEYGGTWTQEGDTISLFIDGEADSTVQIRDDGSLVVYFDETGLVLVRAEAGEAQGEIPAAVEVQDLSQLDGEYKLAGAFLAGQEIDIATLGMNTNVTVTVKDGSAHLTSTWDSGFVYEVDVETRLADGKVTTSEIDFGGDVGKLGADISLREDGSMIATVSIPFGGQQAEIEFVLVRIEEAAGEPAA